MRIPAMLRDRTWAGGLAAAAALTASLAGAPAAQAFSHYTAASGDTVHWDNYHLEFQVPSDDWDDADTRDAIEEAMDLFEDNPSNFWFGAAEDDDGFSSGNGESELAFTGDLLLHCGAPACTHLYWDGSNGEMEETDVYMNTGESWSTSHTKTDLNPYGGSGRPVQTTMLHEMGHAAGLGHEAFRYNIMGADWTHIHANGNTATAYMGEDACAGLVDLYGEYEYHEDLGVAHWRRSGRSGEYSLHDRAEIWDDTFHLMTPTTLAGEPYYTMDKGGYYVLRFQLENMGGDSQTTDLSFRLSTNSMITSWDREIRRVDNRSVTPDRPYYAFYAVDIPEDISTRDYWIGVIVDPDGDLWETREDNNATYVARVRIE